MVQVQVEGKAVETLAPYSGKPGARYQLEKPFYVDDMLIGEGETIEFDGIPNESMKPLNEAGYYNLSEFYRLNGGGNTPSVADMMEKAMRERPREGSVNRLDQQNTVPLTGSVVGDGMPKPKPKEPTVNVVPQEQAPKYIRPVRTQGAGVNETPSTS